jgi:predicted TIM-barrel fold metal-dependent hydrolase
MQKIRNNLLYAPEDFYRLEKIDAHVHVNGDEDAFIQQSKADNFKLLSVNVDAGEFPSIEEQMAICENLLKENRDCFAFVSTFPIQGWEKENWVERTLRRIDAGLNKGAVAVKIWKNIGMEYKDDQGRFVMIDNPGFTPVFEHIVEKNIPLLAHIGEPKDCWLPLEQISLKYIHDYYQNHPQYHMYRHPEFPSYAEQIASRDRMLDNNPELKFLAVHLASLEWDISRVAQFLTTYSNAHVDLAARMMYLQYQSVKNHRAVRDFFLTYQDRILYGSDIIQEPGISADCLKNGMHTQWINDWQFLVTAQVMQTNEFEGDFKGLALPRPVIDKIYRENAQRMFPQAWRI